MTDKPDFRPGSNIAIKCPEHQFEEMCRFYKSTLGLEVLEEREGYGAFRFGSIRLWVDRCPQLSQAEIWLEIQTDDSRKAALHLKDAGIPFAKGLEPLPDDLKGFWAIGPGGVVHLINERSKTED